ncbi:nonribosomal peptide synthase [Penicillium soppii]|uniref:nonribosomal peptide synthase n=1 Tax=Penicillium soppii TaxID=69789 RepID=UPI0025480C19|nr:nonribosomal peptide synthase [Penicillium soppii]KAJ5851865.1 nonribosomal peptide synthase [Penicillium soppii]
MATLAKVAWVHILSQTAGHQDVTFTQTVNGRGHSLKDADRILGPCLNYIPVRVQVQSSTLRVRDLLEKAQNQHTQSLRYESIECSDLGQHSTC